MSESHVIDLDESDPQPWPVCVAATVGIAVTAVLILLLVVVHRKASEAENYRKVVAEAPLELRSMQAEQRELLNRYRWVDEANGVVSIPIDRAIQLVAEEN